MKHKIIPIILIATLLTGCKDNTPVETTMEEASIDLPSETTIDPTKEETTEIIIEETISTETTEHNPVLTLKQIEFNGVLPDGEYFVTISSFDDDCSGAIFNVNGYWCLTEEEISNIIVGDTLIMGTAEYVITHCDLSHPYFGVESSDVWGTQKQRNGFYYLSGYLRIYDKTLKDYVKLDGTPGLPNETHFKIKKRSEM